MEKEQYLNIGRPNKTCLLCGASLADEGKHPSILTKWENEAIRKDFCSRCWEKLGQKDYFSYWITRRLKPGPNRRLSRKERNDLLLRLFETLHARGEEHEVYTLYFLAHLLMRYKVFKWKGAVTEETGDPDVKSTYLVFENRKTGEEIRIPDQDLDGEKIAETKKEIDAYLSEHLPIEEEPPTSPTNDDESE